MRFDSRLLAGIGVLTAVVETGGFTHAAEALGMTASGVSRAIARLEASLGRRLLERTTRVVRLSADGAAFYRDIKPLLDGVEAAVAAMSGPDAVRGRLRVNVDAWFAQQVLAPQVSALRELHPDLELELLTQDHVGDLISDGMDMAIRFGEPQTGSLIARRLLTTRVLTVAAPDYLTRCGRPLSPEDVAGHQRLQFRNPHTGRLYGWIFQRGETIVETPARGALTFSESGALLAACLGGAGLAQILELGTESLLREGRLIELFPEWRDEVFPLYVLFPAGREPSARARALVDFLLRTCA
jgi:DNA-binding transcriptional LysR family regulator